MNRPNQDFRGFAGTIVAGRLRKGDAVRVQPSGRVSRVSRIVTFDGDLDEAVAGQSITITLDDEIDISRGDLIVAADEPAEIADQFEATVVWMNEAPLLRGRDYLMKIGTKTVTATVSPLKYKINVNTLEHTAAVTLELNDIGVANLQLDRPIAFDPYEVNRDTGGFILIDRVSNDTVGAGMLHFALRRAHNVQWQALDVNKTARAAIKGQKPCVLWYTGLSGRRQVDDRQPGGQEASQHEAAHLPARRRQRPPRHEQGSRLHRRRPRREHPPHRRDGQAHGGRGPHRQHRLHLPVPRRAPDGARPAGRGRVHRDLRRHAARASPSSAIRRASTRRPGAAI